MQGVGKSLEMSPGIPRGNQFFRSVIPTSLQIRAGVMMAVCGTRWDDQKAPLCNISEAYAAWVMLCKTQSKSRNDTWGKAFHWLTQPQTYLKVKFLADFL